MKKLSLIVIVLIISINLMAQVNKHKFDFKFGSGLGFMGSGDVTALCFENELNYKFNHYVSTSVSLGIGRTFQNVYSHNDYLLGSLNLFLSPFKNNGRNNFKIGGGYTLINETALYNPDRYNLDYMQGNYNAGYYYLTRRVDGFSIIVEDEYMINSKFLIGGKIFVTGGRSEGGIVSGGMIKLGVLL